MAGHEHCHDHARSNESRAALAFALTAAFMVVEAVGGWLSGSLALVADAVHMLTDAVALAMAWMAFRLGGLPADDKRSYGYRRFEVLAAFVNGLTVVALSAWLAWEAVTRLLRPEPVDAGPMLVVAAVGLGVNLLVLRVLGGHGHDQDNVNIRGAVLHVLGDLLGSAGAVVAALVIMSWGWTPADPLLSLAVAVMILVGAARLVKSASHILMEGTPEGFDGRTVCDHLSRSVPGVAEVHHLHAWSLTSGEALVTLHVRLGEGADGDGVLAAVKAELESRFHLHHSVIQVERGACPDRSESCA